MEWATRIQQLVDDLVLTIESVCVADESQNGANSALLGDAQRVVLELQGVVNAWKNSFPIYATRNASLDRVVQQQ